MQGGGESGRVYLGRLLKEYGVEEKITMRLTLVEMGVGFFYLHFVSIQSSHFMYLY